MSNLPKYLKLIASFAFLYVFFVYITPLFTHYFPNWTHFAKTADENNIEPGAIYYTNVPVTSDSEHANREAVEKVYGSSLGWKPFVEDKDIKTDSK